MGTALLFRWGVPQPQDLVVFLGRSLGVVVSLLAIFAFVAVRSPEAKPFFFDLMLATLAAMLALHINGAIRKTQPITETAEIGLWVVLLLMTLSFCPA